METFRLAGQDFRRFARQLGQLRGIQHDGDLHAVLGDGEKLIAGRAVNGRDMERGVFDAQHFGGLARERAHSAASASAWLMPSRPQT